ncbi:MAG: hypothetical protein VB061_07500 [Christensenella sp.]|nr:hypothetical protein [Christensenella sp.]
MKSQPTKPRKIHIQVTEHGNQTADVRLPYGMFRLGMKYGKDAAKNETDACAKAMAQLQDFDCASFERSVASGEIALPHVLLDTIVSESNSHVVMIAE